MENIEEKSTKKEKVDEQENINTKKIKGPGNFIVWAGVILIITVIITLAAIMWDSEERRDDRNILATVNGEKITMLDIRSELDQAKKQFTDQGTNISEDEEMEYMVTIQVLQNHINQKVLLSHAEKLGLEVNEEEISEQYELIKNQFETEADFEDALEQSNLTTNKLEKNIGENLIIQHLAEKEGDVDVTDKEVEDYYNELSNYVDEDLPPLEEIRLQIAQEIENEKIQSAIMTLLESLEQEYEIKILIEAPEPKESENEALEETLEINPQEEEMETPIEE